MPCIQETSLIYIYSLTATGPEVLMIRIENLIDLNFRIYGRWSESLLYLVIGFSVSEITNRMNIKNWADGKIFTTLS